MAQMNFLIVKGIVPGIALRKHYIMDLIDIEVRPSAERVARSCNKPLDSCFLNGPGKT